jgi:hypothetical protein
MFILMIYVDFFTVSGELNGFYQVLDLLPHTPVLSAQISILSIIYCFYTLNARAGASDNR